MAQGKIIFFQFSPQHMKIPSIGDKILSMDKSVIRGKKWWMILLFMDVIHG